MKIYYGIGSSLMDVTDICFTHLKHEDIIVIPCGDCNRARYFTDPCIGVLKSIFIEQDQMIEYDVHCTITINTSTNIITAMDIDTKIRNIHSTLKIKHGSLMDELPEQKMVCCI